jgi:hypothetical protein
MTILGKKNEMILNVPKEFVSPIPWIIKLEIYIFIIIMGQLLVPKGIIDQVIRVSTLAWLIDIFISKINSSYKYIV